MEYIWYVGSTLSSASPSIPVTAVARLKDHYPKESITREQAIIAYTYNVSFVEFVEAEKGSIEPGKLADIAVLSQDGEAVAGQSGICARD
jgi:predicted amidohydrolase YtcJ